MDTAFGNKIDSNFNILPFRTKKAIIFLSKQSWMNESDWYLAGGTALALQAGHRRSVDLDFFTTQKDFDKSELLNNFSKNNEWRTTINKKNTIYGELFKAKVSFIAYPFFIPQQDFIQYDSIKILHKIDIAVMKIVAISQRGRKRDFFDLYWCAKNIEPLEKTIRRLKIQYSSVAHDYHHILKSLAYFNDAENDPEPDIYFDASWSKIKKFFKTEIPKITKNIMRLD
ncbi:MAG: nucleotidyl transferase AbiEii/AbiGii toxin family protein [Patescibacteria group bacterium]